MSKLYPTCRSVNKSLLTAVLSFFLLTFVSIGFAQSPSNILVTGATPANFTMQQFGTIGTGTASAPDYCQTPANQSRPECQGSVTNTYTNTYTNNSVPSYCANAANANRPECQTGYTQTTQTQIQPIQTTQVVNNQTTNGQVPSYCQTPANQSRPECQGSSFQTSTQTNTFTYASYCYEAQYSTRQECQGLYQNQIQPIQTQPTQTRPTYCNFVEYQNRPECVSQLTPVTTIPSTTTNQYPAYCANPANQFLVACQANNTVNTVVTNPSTIPAYCQTPANQSRPECQGSVTTPITPTPQPCQAGYYIPNCVNVTVPRPCIVGIYDPLCNPVTVPPVTTTPVTPIVVTPPFTAPINCPPGISNSNCLSASNFALPTPPAPVNCQQNANNNPQAARDYCSALYFTHPGAYLNGATTASLRRFQNFSFLMRSPFAGHAYLFTRSADGTIQALLPNQQILQPVDVKLYNQVQLPQDTSAFGTNYSFAVNQPITEVFYVVLTQAAPINTFISVRTDQELQSILLNLGLAQGIYHGIAGAPVITTN